MSDDLSNKGPADSSRVSTGESWEIYYWTEKFGCSEEELKEAVKQVGNMSQDVEEYFNSKNRD